MMFPYPSAEGLHVGNLYAYTGADIYGRFKAMQGYQVFEPMGFDAFGIHSENFAIKRGIHPTAAYRRKRRALPRDPTQSAPVAASTGARGHHDRAGVLPLDAVDLRPTLQGRTRGTSEGGRQLVPDCGTVLADEQGHRRPCERCETPVEQRELEQWFLRITAFADRLLANLDHLDWSENVKSAQRRWIGRSEGLQFEHAGRRPARRSD